MVSSTSAARGVVVTNGRALGTRRDRAAARNSCGRMIEQSQMEDRRGKLRGAVDGGGGEVEEGAVVQSSRNLLGCIT